MAKVFYVAVLERAGEGFSVFFPDLPGCTSAGDTMQDAALNAEEALALHVAGMIEDGEALPQPTSADAIEADPEVEEAGRFLVAAPEMAKVRVNVVLDAPLIAAIDAVSANRSRFLTEAARAKLKELAAA